MSSGSAGAEARNPVRIVLVDDQPLIRRGFAAILETEPGFEVVGEAANGREAVELTRKLRPDVVCMDVQMPVLDGIAATREIQADPELRSSILVLTTFDHDEFLFEALAAGASGFLLKTAEAEELIAAISTLAQGDALLAPEVTGRVLQRLVTHAAEETTSGARATPAALQAEDAVPRELELLTEREHEILLLVATGLSNAQIAEQLFIGPATVKTHVSNALMKIGVRDRVHAVIWAYENGLMR